MKYCYNCGNKIENENNKFCPECGAELTNNKIKSNTEQIEKTLVEPNQAIKEDFSTKNFVPIDQVKISKKSPWPCLVLALIALVCVIISISLIDKSTFLIFTLAAFICSIIAIAKSGHRGGIGVLGKVLGIIVLVMSVAMFVIGSTSSKNTSSTSTIKEKTATETETTTKEAKTYTYYYVTVLFDELDENALRAETNHQNEYVEIEGYLGTIDSDGKYFCIEADSSDYSYFLNSVHCDINSSSVKNTIMNMNEGDRITVKGHITEIGEILGYVMDAEEVY